MIAGARIGVLGGTLDPIHLGHLDAATAAREALALESVLVIPSHVPPHRTQPIASPYHRFAMAALAVNGIDGFAVSDEELCAPGRSFTADTLTRLHARGLSASQIFFITGADAFAEIETWSRYPQVLELARFIVISRPGFPATVLPGRIAALADRMATPGQARQRATEPSIFLVDARTRDISSTGIRQRLARGEPVSGLVPASVEAHIRQHGLYSGAPRDGSTPSTADHLHGQD
jgi:nicotinate-nucleotide adenylyltransferase